MTGFSVLNSNCIVGVLQIISIMAFKDKRVKRLVGGYDNNVLMYYFNRDLTILKKEHTLPKKQSEKSTATTHPILLGGGGGGGGGGRGWGVLCDLFWNL